jgi:ABC-type transporter MlaC component
LTGKPVRGSLCALVAAIALAAGTVQAGEENPALQLMQRTTDELLLRLNEESDLYSDDIQHLYRIIEEVILPVVDVQTFSRLILGKHWQSYSDSKRSDFVESFQSMMIRTYGKRLLTTDVANLKFEYDSKQKNDPGKRYQIVKSRIILGGGEAPLDISYSLIDRDGWKVFDIIIDGTSLARQLRGAYAAEIQEDGPDALLARLKNTGARKAGAE